MQRWELAGVRNVETVTPCRKEHWFGSTIDGSVGMAVQAQKINSVNC